MIAGIRSAREPPRARLRSMAVALLLLAAAAPVATGCTAARGTVPLATPAVEATHAAARATASASVPHDAVQATVTRVVDGDTLEVELYGERWKVRLILVDTPEISGEVGCYGETAAAFTRATAPPGTPVVLERDVSQTDRYGRLLRYVYLPNGAMLNELIARGGYGRLAVFPPDVRYLERIAAAEAEARTSDAGLWGACEVASPTPAATTADASTAAPTSAFGMPPVAGCDLSYLGGCIPAPPPDSDCGNIS